MPEGVKVIKWPYKEVPTADAVAQELQKYGYKTYDLQTIPPWFERSMHAHDYPEIRGAIKGVTTFHFEDGPVTIEAGDILFIAAGIPHEVRTHNAGEFSAYKGSTSGKRSVTELDDARGSLESLQKA